jgi:3-hydroxyisobutyrate dehydrogenase-like beta-hydroxyacid dehydrogenase
MNFKNYQATASGMATIGFIGIGTMGAGMVKNLAKHNHKVIAYNRTRERAEELAAQDDRITAGTLDDVAETEAIITCISNDQALDETLFKSGFLQRLRQGQTLIDSGTTSVEMTERIAAACAKQGVAFLDAPVTGSRAGAESGTLLFMAGGERKTFDAMIPVMQAMGTRQVYCGPQTHGQRAKIALNLAQAMILESYLEGLALGIKEGVPLDAMIEILDNSGAKCGIGTVKLATIRKRDFVQRFKLSLMYKDLLLAQQEIAKLKLTLPIAQQMPVIYREAMAHPDEDFSITAATIEKHAGIEFK